MSATSGINPTSQSSAAPQGDAAYGDAARSVLIESNDTVELGDGGEGSPAPSLGCCLCVALFYLCSCIRSCLRALFCCGEEADAEAPEGAAPAPLLAAAAPNTWIDKAAATELLTLANADLKKILLLAPRCKLVVRFCIGIGTENTYVKGDENSSFKFAQQVLDQNLAWVVNNNESGMVCFYLYDNVSSSPAELEKGPYVAVVGVINATGNRVRTYYGDTEELLKKFNADPFLNSFGFITEELSLPQ